MRGSYWTAPNIRFVIGIILLVGISIPASSFAANDKELHDELRESLEKNISSEMSELFRSELKDTGLSSADIEQVIADLEDATAECFVNSVVEHAQTHDVPLADLIIELDGDKAITPVGVDFVELLDPCLNAARMEAGIAME